QANFDMAKKAVDDYLNSATENRDLKVRAEFRQLRKKLLASAVPFYEQLLQQKQGDDRWEAERGLAYGRLATLQVEMGERQEALAHFEEMSRIFSRLSAGLPVVASYREELAKSYDGQAVMLVALGRPKEALAAFEQAEPLFKQLAAEFPDTPVY